MNINEKVFTFGSDNSLVGIVTSPQYLDQTSMCIGVILLNAGLLHRVGPNRFYVKLARLQAKKGFVSMRFDFSGIGDSPYKDFPYDPWERKIKEAQEAMNFLTLHTGIKRFVLCGLCSGGEAALRIGISDSRVVGMVGINTTYIVEGQREKTKNELKQQIQNRYYSRKLFDLASWRRVVSGKSNITNIIKFLQWRAKRLFPKIRQEFPEICVPDIWEQLISREIQTLLVYSDGSPAWDYFHNTLSNWLQQKERTENLQVIKFSNTDHIFTLIDSQKHLIDTIDNWMKDQKQQWIIKHKLIKSLSHIQSIELSKEVHKEDSKLYNM